MDIRNGWKKGLEEGNSKGIEQGIELSKLEIAENMLNENMNIELISKITKLSKEEIEKLKNKKIN